MDICAGDCFLHTEDMKHHYRFLPLLPVNYQARSHGFLNLAVYPISTPKGAGGSKAYSPELSLMTHRYVPIQIGFHRSGCKPTSRRQSSEPMKNRYTIFHYSPGPLLPACVRLLQSSQINRTLSTARYGPLLLYHPKGKLPAKNRNVPSLPNYFYVREFHSQPSDTLGIPRL